jgi:methylmalonyl-CoA/ethylmalonyl-CoA epimerase
MKLLGVEHIGIAVSDLEDCIARFESAFGIKCEGRERIEASKVEVAFFRCGDTKIELVTPTDPASPIQGFLTSRGNGIHHICLDVEGIDAWLKSLGQAGIDLIDKKPRRGATGRSVAFISPKSLCNILVELSEETQ